MLKREELLPGCEHFTWKEFIRQEDPDPPLLIQQNLMRLSKALEVVRKLNGNVPLLITSGWRTEAHNGQIPGAAKHSEHLQGLAADISKNSLKSATIAWLKAHWVCGFSDYDDGHVHLDIGPNRRW